jgi:hypothetical protein
MRVLNDRRADTLAFIIAGGTMGALVEIQRLSEAAGKE